MKDEELERLVGAIAEEAGAREAAGIAQFDGSEADERFRAYVHADLRRRLAELEGK